jgi:tannase
MLKFDLESIASQPHSCADENSTSLGVDNDDQKCQAPGSTYICQPAQNRTVSKGAIAVAKAIYEGLHNSNHERAYRSWQVASDLGDVSTVYNNNMGS